MATATNGSTSTPGAVGRNTPAHLRSAPPVSAAAAASTYPEWHALRLLGWRGKPGAAEGALEL